ncbi:biopolymer transport protein ExbD [Monaibacterium marinum]|uniref:Biopolymer transport protein ExbD n=1 Tax=Pontivivens marinum TaxID=1690039 RepID=A0A2C9CRD4_9RHOB|nr:biopolymer transporter ExbD [Monaibacterium marinum]SOH93802.1 biopolymer transport protein ExbD [Monaibacterium marinum]
MPLGPATPRSRPESTIALINIVFLMLIFFMVAGTLAPPLDARVSLVETENLDGRAPPDATVLTSDGTLSYRGAPTTTQEIIARAAAESAEVAVRIVVDRAVAATTLMEHAASLRAAGAQQVWIITERGL